MSPVTMIPDDPIKDEHDDFLGRARFANSLSDLIINAPKGMTLRIGVYGGWGEGKTSVLELMSRRLKAQEHVCVFLQSWVSTTTDALLQRLIRDIMTELGCSASALNWTDRLQRWFTSGRKAADIDPRIKAADAVLGEALSAVLGAAVKKQTAAALQQINDELGDRKLIIFVDDLDRVRPELIPELLLTLREALNQPNYFYVMALAPDIVQAGLESINKKWGEATSFLEKIIELPRQLPRPTADEVRLFVRKQLDRLGASHYRERLEDLRHILSTNPRKLKSFLRYIGSIQPMLDRFDPGEIEWGVFFIAQILRIEFPLEAAKMMDDASILDDLETNFIKQSVNAQGNKAPTPALYVKYAPKDEGTARDRFIQLCEELRKRGRWRGRFNLKALFALPDEPPITTWKEMEAFVVEYTKATADAKKKLVDTFVKPDGHVDAACLAALFEIVIEFRQGYISDAVDQQSEQRVKEQLAVVAVLDEILRDLIVRHRVFRDEVLGAAEWFELFSHFEKWAHFVQPAYHSDVRLREREILKESVADITPGFAMEILNKWHDVHLSFGEKKDFQEAIASLQNVLRRQVAEWVALRLTQAEGLGEIQSDEQRSARVELFDPHSLLFTDASLRKRFEAIAANAKTDGNIHANFTRIVGLLNYGAFGSGTSMDIQACRDMLADHSLLKTVWDAAVARRLQPRFAGSLREFRMRAIEFGVPENVLQTPPWWTELEKTFFAKEAKVE